MVGYDRFRNGRFRTKQVTESFQTEIEGTRNILRAGHKQARVERRVSPPLLLRAATAHNQPRNTLTPTPCRAATAGKTRRAETAHGKHVNEHKVAQWELRKGGNGWGAQSRQCKLFRDEVRMDAVEGKYRDPIRTMHGCVTDDPQRIHPDFKRVLTVTPDSPSSWSVQDYNKNRAFATAPSLRRPCTDEGRYRFNGNRSLPADFKLKKSQLLNELEQRAESVASGELGRKRADFIHRTRFFTGVSTCRIHAISISVSHAAAYVCCCSRTKST